MEENKKAAQKKKISHAIIMVVLIPPVSDVYLSVLFSLLLMHLRQRVTLCLTRWH